MGKGKKERKEKQRARLEERTRLEEKMFLCMMCGRSYTKTVDLLKHGESSHLSGFSRCETCETLWETDNDRDNHAIEEHDTHQCPICKTYFSEEGLKKHSDYCLI